MCCRHTAVDSWASNIMVVKMWHNTFCMGWSYSNQELAASVLAAGGRSQTGNTNMYHCNCQCPWFMLEITGWRKELVWTQELKMEHLMGFHMFFLLQYDERSSEKSSHSYCTLPVALSLFHSRSLFKISNTSGKMTSSFLWSMTVFVIAEEVRFFMTVLGCQCSFGHNEFPCVLFSLTAVRRQNSVAKLDLKVTV